MMMGFGGGWMMLWMILFWIAVVGVALWLLSRLFPGTRQGSGGQGSPANGTMNGGAARAVDILNQRYARGEITRAEYQQIRQDIEG